MSHRFLIADDSDSVQKAISLALHDYNVEIIKASSFLEMHKVSKQSHIDFIVADAALTGIDSPSDFKIIVDNHPQTPILLLEGTFETIDQEAFAAIGLKNFLQKPFNQKDLLKKITSQLKLKSNIPENQDSQSSLIPPPPPPPPPPLPIHSSIPFDQNIQTTAQGPMENEAIRFHPPPPPESTPPNLFMDGGLNFQQKSLPSDVKAMIEGIYPQLLEEVKKEIWSYCQKNFREIAKEILEHEIQKLVQEKIDLMKSN